MAYSLPLIDKTDGFEDVRDAVAGILASEQAAQYVLAVADGEVDPKDWQFKVYIERFAPWEVLQEGDSTPVVNIWFESSSYDMRKSNLSTRQQTGPTVINIDCYAPAINVETDTGHTPSDEAAARKVHRICRLVRNIIMADKYMRLGLDIVAKRWVDRIDTFQLPPEVRPSVPVAACRIVLNVDHSETIDLPDEGALEIINIKFYHEPDGQVIAEMQYGEEEE